MKYIGIKPYTNWRYPFKTIYEWTVDTPRMIKDFVQRGYRGYSDRDVWSMDWYLAHWMPVAIENLRDNSYGNPITMDEWSETEDDHYKIWCAILTAIADGFRAAYNLQEMSYLNEYKGEVTFPGENKWDAFGDWLDKNREKHDALETEWHDEVKLGMNLFVEFYLNLWD